MVATKQALRENIWQAMQDAGVDRFPGATGRIPNFNGAKEARAIASKSDISDLDTLARAAGIVETMFAASLCRLWRR